MYGLRALESIEGERVKMVAAGGVVGGSLWWWSLFRLVDKRVE